MALPIEDLTPKQIVSELDRYIVGQDAAKRAIGVAMRNRFRRQQLPADERDDVLPKNILMIGPTGVGKTEIARRLAALARAPFIKVEATKFTEVGYVGRDVESMIRELAAAAIRLVEGERTAAVREPAMERVYDRLVGMLDESPWSGTIGFSGFDDESEKDPELDKRREQLRLDLKAGKLDDREVEFEVEEANNPFMQVFTPQGIEEMGIDTSNPGSMFGTRYASRRATVADAIPVLFEEEAKRMTDRASIYREAIYRAEQTGIIFLDEIDKVAGKQGGSGPDVSREGVQRDLLPIIEGSTVATKYGPVRTDHILFVAAGAFHISRPSDLIPELQGRLPIRVELDSLNEEDFRRILTEPKNALTRQYSRLLAMDGVEISFTDAALDELAHVATEINAKTDNIGARRLHTVMEWLLEDLLFEAPETSQKRVEIGVERVRDRLNPVLANLDKSRNVL